MITESDAISFSSILAKKFGLDLSSYSPTFIVRRIESRMRRLALSDLTGYYAYLMAHPDELSTIRSELSIHVTNFFRDKAMYDVFMLESMFEVLKRKDDSGKRVVRIWSAGCSSGEEPYSIAIILHELLGLRIRDYHIQIMATDIDRYAIESARAGIYGDGSMKETDPMIVKKYFTPSEAGYIVNEQVKSLVTFSEHDLMKDPKPRDQDVIFCRNVVIYFSRESKEALYEDFFRCLNPGGFLVLGKTETLTGSARDKFRIASISEKIYKKD